MGDKKRAMPPLINRRFVQEAPTSYDRQSRTVDAVLSNGSAVKRFFGTEVLSTKPGHVDLDRLKTSGIPLLDSHQVYGVNSLLGRVDDVRFESGQIVGRLRFGDTEEARKAEGMVARGELTGVSIGYQVSDWTVTDGEGNVRDPDKEILNIDDELTFTATRWALLEASLVTVPADASARIRAHNVTKDIAMSEELIRAAEDDDEKARKAKEAEEESARVEAQQQADGGDDKPDESRRAVPAMRRSASLLQLVTIDRQARELGIDLNLEAAIMANEKPEAMRIRMFDALTARSKATGPESNTGPARLELIRDENEGKREALEIALVTRILGSNGHNGIDYAPKNKAEARFVEAHRAQASQYTHMGLVELAAESIGYRGHIRNNAAAMQVLEEAFRPGSTTLHTRAFHSTSDFPNIFQNALNKALLARYELMTPTYRNIAVERPFNDFRPHPQIRAGDFPVPQPVQETGELRYGTATDSGESLSVKAYGTIFSISRQMLVNDDLGAIDQLLGSAGDVVMVWENDTFFTMLKSNPVLNTDSVAVFNSAHGNLATAGADPSITTISAGRAAMRGMTTLGGLHMNVPPAIILTGPIEETQADQMVATITPTLTTAYNPFSGKLRAVADANITDKSWYLLAEPGRVPVFVYGFLNGAAGPRIRTYEPFGVQGIKVSLEIDFGVGAIDYRGAWMSPTF